MNNKLERNYFVKFVPWNEWTLENLINNSIKFSTVHEFNDFNEYRYISNLGNEDKILNILEEEIKKVSFLNNFKTLANHRCSNEYKLKINNLLESGKQEELLKEDCLLKLLSENLAYSSVGIFCVSSIKVFENDSAQLMFAHYAQNNKGLALIYEKGNTKIDELKYEFGLNISSAQWKEYFQWYEGKYNSRMEDFLCKSDKWGYEKEYRIFERPGIKQLNDDYMVLKAILYTPRFSGKEEVLSQINEKFYKKKLIIEKIKSSNSEPHFVMEKKDDDKFIKVIDFLKKTLITK